MSYQLNEDQSSILDGVTTILDRLAGPQRAMELGVGAHDGRLWGALIDSGYLDVGRGPDTGALEAALVVEAIAAAGGLVAAAPTAIVAPALLDTDVGGPIALADHTGSQPVRFAPVARTVFGIDADEVVMVTDLTDDEVTAVKTSFAVPAGRIGAQAWERGERLGPGSGDLLRRWWRVANAVEQAGLLRSALALTVDYVNRREQFGHPIARFQAVRHRLAECAVLIEGTRWLSLEAAAHGAPPEAAAIACTHATAAAKHVVGETHQLTGAMGFTKEYALHVYTTRSQGLTLELGGLEAHSRSVSKSRWGTMMADG
jgi:alkylation response protein AidB-like acyl-CoA dehydrogenase